MSLGDVLERRKKELANSSINSHDSNAFWKILRDIAREEIISLYPHEVSSTDMVPIYYDILSKNINCIPKELCSKCKNHQEKYRIKIRNLISTNAFHSDGLANQPGIIARKELNVNRGGRKTVYKGDSNYATK